MKLRREKEAPPALLFGPTGGGCARSASPGIGERYGDWRGTFNPTLRRGGWHRVDSVAHGIADDLGECFCGTATGSFGRRR